MDCDPALRVVEAAQWDQVPPCAPSLWVSVWLVVGLTWPIGARAHSTGLCADVLPVTRRPPDFRLDLELAPGVDLFDWLGPLHGTYGNPLDHTPSSVYVNGTTSQ